MIDLPHDFKDLAIIPRGIISIPVSPGRMYEGITRDDVAVQIGFTGLFCNIKNACHEELDRISINSYGVPFHIVNNKWRSIIDIDDWWYTIKMKRINEVRRNR